MENTRVQKTVRQSSGSLLVTLANELKFIRAQVGGKVTVTAGTHRIEITKAVP